ncbi:MAG: hypothetical protein A2498_15075 [Lentisphaerae bacterium RIFOXYC12_FULL_60_16]|nr:MAG: hypothetical protein A2498_15075 [Lentisphaerae bacterium RIFOXYC12_FULL_60_16]
MPDQNPQPTIPKFRSRGVTEWRPLAMDGDGDDTQKSNKEDLHNVLLGSLQMQHLVVLAGSGCSLSAGGPSMTDLWDAAVDAKPAVATRIAKRVGQNLDVKNIETFLSRIEAFLALHENARIARFLNVSKGLILDKCSEFLQMNKLDAHKTFLHRLSRRRVRDQRLKVFTTNYDLCFERATGELGGVALDGFSFAAPRSYDPRFFSYDIIRRPRGGDDLGHYLEGVFLLYKLHGSVNWARTADGTIIERVNPNPQEACLIYPATGKYQQSFTQPHLESMAQYLAAVREPNTCVLVVGFGFNDDHLAEPLLDAAKSNPHLRLIIVDSDAEDKVANGNKYWKGFKHLGERGEDVWFIAATFGEFARMIPDLKSLTPADTLMKAIQNATRER